MGEEEPRRVGLVEAPAVEGAGLISLEKVSKRYGAGGTLALEDVNLSVRRGEFLSIVGPSGCGKSTILRLIAGLGESSSGSVRVLGRTPDEARRATGRLAPVFQEATLMPWRTVLRNTELPLEIKGVTKKGRREAARAALEMVGLDGSERLHPRQLSGGMKMRVSIARAMVSEPEILLMDEPFGALDELTRQKLQEDLLRIWREAGLTVVFVTHNVFEAIYLSERIAVMSAHPGRIRDTVEVDAPHPRGDEFRASPEFGRLVAETTRALRGDIPGGR